ncbi:hypothetical protein [Actinomyces wuliandei]|uniref:hypothetical protein n=1 Tax=Actinomyces wuliandei TaxID=2057743 RepID=UPI0013E35D79|nr:hypothetical protein [Actinomyces wuliandei]
MRPVVLVEYDGPPGVDPGTSLKGVPKTDRVPTELRVYLANAGGVPRTFPNK